MRYLNNKQQREQVKSLKGNLLRVNQDDLAKDLGVTQGRISQMIENLLDEKKSLTSQVTKMQDPDYLARYAKEKYLYSKEDEVIIRID